MQTFRYAVLYHNYYDMEGVADIRRRIALLGREDVLLLCSLPEKFASEMPLQTERERYVLTANIGKDIGAKLLLTELLLAISPETEFVIMMHDKRSYQKSSGKFERDSLFGIIGPEAFGQIAAAFSDSSLGIACARGYKKNEYDGRGQFLTTNGSLLKQLIDQYQLRLKDYHFVAGTMFWIRTSILRSFFGGSRALSIRGDLEKGNILDHEKGSLTHSWERGLSWIASSAGYAIKEFPC